MSYLKGLITGGAKPTTSIDVSDGLPKDDVSKIIPDEDLLDILSSELLGGVLTLYEIKPMPVQAARSSGHHQKRLAM